MAKSRVFQSGMFKDIREEIALKASELKEIPASEFLLKLEAGGEVRGHRVRGDLELGRNRFEKAIALENCVFEGVQGIGSCFADKLAFKDCEFQGTVLFGKNRQPYLERPEPGAVFQSSASFCGCRFLGVVSFQGCLAKNLKLADSLFSDELLIGAAEIEQTLSISGTEHAKLVYVVDSRIKAVHLQNVTSLGPWRFDRSNISEALNLLNDVRIRESFSCFELNVGKFRAQGSGSETGELNLSHMCVLESMKLAQLSVRGLADMRHLRLEKHVPANPRMARPNLVEIIHCHFESGANWNEMCILGEFRAGDNRFEHSFSCEACELHQEMDLARNSFNGPASFSRTKFFQAVNFDNSIFHYITDFRETSFLDKVSFHKTIFGSLADFTDCEFHNDINFLKTEAEKVKIEQKQVEDYIVYEDGQNRPGVVRKISRVLLIVTSLQDGQSIARKYEENSQEYSFLKAIFEGQNDFDAADWAYFMMKRSERMACLYSSYKNPRNFVRYLIGWFLEWICGYGTRPFRAVGSSLVLIFLFALIYFLNYEAFAGDERVLTPIFPDYPVWNQITVCLYLSVVAFTYGLGDVLATGVTAILVMLQSLMGLLLVGLFIVSFSRKVIR